MFVSAKQGGTFKSSLWPPYRIPEMASKPYQDPRYLLHSNVLQAVVFVILYKAYHTINLSDQMLALSVYLLEMALTVCEPTTSDVRKNTYY